MAVSTATATGHWNTRRKCMRLAVKPSVRRFIHLGVPNRRSQQSLCRAFIKGTARDRSYTLGKTLSFISQLSMHYCAVCDQYLNIRELSEPTVDTDRPLSSAGGLLWNWSLTRASAIARPHQRTASDLSLGSPCECTRRNLSVNSCRACRSTAWTPGWARTGWDTPSPASASTGEAPSPSCCLPRRAVRRACWVPWKPNAAS